MPKTYFNDAVIGNSSMLACITGGGSLTRLYWPHIDHPQHIERLAEGVFLSGVAKATAKSREGLDAPETFLSGQDTTVWLDENCWDCEQAYAGDTNILETVFSGGKFPGEIRRTDFALPDEDILVRHYEFCCGEADAGEAAAGFDLSFVSYTSFISTNSNPSSVLFDFNLDAPAHYKYDNYFMIASDSPVSAFQLGNNAFEASKTLELRSNDQIGMMHDLAVVWKLGFLAPGDRKSLTLYFCASGSLKGVRKLAERIKTSDYRNLLKQTRDYWSEVLNRAKAKKTGSEQANRLYRRSVLLFSLMSDKHSGGLLASPEIDEEYTKCGRYAYCWGRDAAFITEALDACGLTGDVGRFYKWAADIQDEEGSWQQRYHMDGNLAPSWGLQIDETGALVFGMLQHYKAAGDLEFLSSMWECMKKGAGFLMKYIDPDTGLPGLSFDLWEERLGEHAYSSAAVYAGLKACCEAAAILGDEGAPVELWEKAADDILAAVERNFWKEDWHRFIRSVRVKLNPWGDEFSGDTVMVKINPKGYERDFTREDWKVDASLLGLAIPFGAYKPDDPKMKGTLEVIEQVLAAPVSGGLRRYEGDNYIGGNPWLITTLWAALYHIRTGNVKKALEYFEWSMKAATPLGLLPEQADRETGKAAWVIPLTWSHAMFVLVLEGLEAAGAI
ncbi:MAG: glycoside hydrolase [Clostridiales bacterium]|nr:glycoside hydrolase [Clostridiales bacterium]